VAAAPSTAAAVAASTSTAATGKPEKRTARVSVSEFEFVSEGGEGLGTTGKRRSVPV
jgi:hypothetical protein